MSAYLLRRLAPCGHVAALVAAATSILGCASLTPAPTGPAAPAPARAAPTVAAAPAAAEGIPDVNVTGALVYQLMSAEVALQRGEIGPAYATYIAVARQTRDPRLARRATEIAINARATPQALDAARLWRELAPGAGEAGQAYGALLVASGRYDEATPLFGELVGKSASPAEELQRVQRILARAGDRDAALALLGRVAQPYRNDPKIGADVLVTLAAGAHAAGKMKLAADEAQAALALRPDFERAALLAAQLLARPDGKDDAAGRAQASALLEKFVARNPKAQEARLTLARLLVADARLPQARAQFSQVLAQDDANLDALYALGVLSLDRPALRADARRFFERYVKLVEAAPADGAQPRTADPAFLNLARIAEDERNYAEALAWLDRVDDGEQYLNARMRKALVLGKLKRVDEGRKLLAATGADNDGERVQLLLTEGQLLRDAGRTKEAFALLDAAVQKNPDDTALLYDTALVAEKLDRTDVMEGYLRRVMQLKPDEAHAFNALGYSLADRNQRLEEARELVAQALKLAPDDGFILDSMGWVHFRLGNLAKAREYLEKAWNQRPHAEVGAHLGEVLWALGLRDDARRIWAESREMEPDNDTLAGTLKRFKVRF